VQRLPRLRIRVPSRRRACLKSLSRFGIRVFLLLGTVCPRHFLYPVTISRGRSPIYATRGRTWVVAEPPRVMTLLLSQTTKVSPKQIETREMWILSLCIRVHDVIDVPIVICAKRCVEQDGFWLTVCPRIQQICIKLAILMTKARFPAELTARVHVIGFHYPSTRQQI